ncbi:MAG: hypothetical protein WCN85_08210 [Burkholderiales bacterium]
MRPFVPVFFAFSAYLFQTAGAFAAPLIMIDEAALPDSVAGPSTRGIGRGPGIKVSSPVDGASLKSPFVLKLDFESRGGVQIDPGSVRVAYLKATPVDLTPRLKGSITAAGINFANAEAPEGKHLLKVSVKDVDGRETNSVVTLIVGK